MNESRDRLPKRKPTLRSNLGSKTKRRKLQDETEEKEAVLEAPEIVSGSVSEATRDEVVDQRVSPLNRKKGRKNSKGRDVAEILTGEEEVETQNMPEDNSNTDPFVIHFEQDLSETDVETLTQLLQKPSYHHSKDPVLGGIGTVECLLKKYSCTFTAAGKSFEDMHVKNALSQLWEPEEGNRFSPIQEKIFEIIASYKDLLFARRTFASGEEIRKIYLLHALNHVLKTRTRILKNNAKVRQASENNIEIEAPRDQGLMRPKVLIIVPFREAALRTVNTLISLLIPKGQGQVNNRKRFIEEFREGEHLKSKVKKPESYDAMFSGNIDDCFRVGISLKKKTVNLYSEFYSSDMILASPLGLRTIIGAEGDKERDFDFLSSLELVIVDQADVFLMQNWEHVQHLFDHTHLQPKESHGVDFSRVRMWSLNGWNKFYRQTLIFCDFLTPEINSLFSSHCNNFAGRMKVFEPRYEGSLPQTFVQVSHVFRKFPCSSHIDLPSARLQYFIEQVLPDFTGDLMKRTAIIIPSYLDFVQIRSKMTNLDMKFASLSEYTKFSEVSRTRTKFFRGEVHFLLYTERLHFFRRYRIRGIHHIIFCCLPNYAEFYPELVNLMSEAPAGITCTVLYSHYDSLALSRIVGSGHARQMIAAQDSLHTFYTK